MYTFSTGKEIDVTVVKKVVGDRSRNMGVGTRGR